MLYSKTSLQLVWRDYRHLPAFPLTLQYIAPRRRRVAQCNDETVEGRIQICKVMWVCDDKQGPQACAQRKQGTPCLQAESSWKDALWQGERVSQTCTTLLLPHGKSSTGTKSLLCLFIIPELDPWASYSRMLKIIKGILYSNANDCFPGPQKINTTPRCEGGRHIFRSCEKDFSLRMIREERLRVLVLFTSSKVSNQTYRV